MSEFRAIVVGAGPVGLVVAHALQAAGIDYLLVEQRSQVPPESAFGIFLWPHIMRILHQLGLLNAIEKIGQPMVDIYHQTMDGELLAKHPGYDMLGAALGYPMMLFDRGSLARELLYGLKDREKHVRTDKRVTNIDVVPDGVKVDFADGSSEKGSIVIGCDGIWSTVREQMSKRAPDGLFDKLPNPFQAPWTGLFARAPRPDGIDPGRTVNIYHHDKQVQVFTTPTEAHIIGYKRITPSREKTMFGHNDAEGTAKPWFDVPIAENVTFGDIWAKKQAGGAANFDEGVLSWWHWDRMVLVGDAAHKMSPIRGAGACCGIEDAITLVNNIHRALQREPEPSRSTLRRAFGAYQFERESPARIWLDISQLNLDLATASARPPLKTIDIADARFLPMIVDGPVLDVLPFTEERTGPLRWKRKPRTRKENNNAKARL